MGLSNLLRMQQRILTKIEKDLAFLQRPASREIQAYEKEYRKEFARPFRVATKDRFIERLQRSRFIFCGDFHTFRQSQRTALRIIRELAQPGETWVIGLECVHERYQSKLNAYLASQITLNELREEIDFDEIWPFPWVNYQDFFSIAKESKFRLLALNTGDRAERELLHDRDLTAAKIIAADAILNEKSKYFIVFGDLHLAKRHLPHAVREILQSNHINCSIETVFQNEPSIFWRLARSNRANTTDVVQLSAHTWCVMSAAPWIRLQSYVDWLQGAASDYEELEIDPGDLSARVQSYSEWIAKALDLAPPTPADLSVVTFAEIHRMKKLESASHRTLLEKSTMEAAIRGSRPLLIKPEFALYLSSFSTNCLAEAATMVLRESIHSEEWALDPRRDFYRLVIRHLRNYFGSKLINPRRKCDEIEDLQDFLRLTENIRGLKLRARRRGVELAIAEANRVLYQHSVNGKSAALRRVSSEAASEAARFLGCIIAERLFYSYQANQVSGNCIRKLFTSSLTDNASAFLLELVREIEKVDYPFSRKTERL